MARANMMNVATKKLYIEEQFDRKIHKLEQEMQRVITGLSEQINIANERLTRLQQEIDEKELILQRINERLSVSIEQIRRIEELN